MNQGYLLIIAFVLGSVLVTDVDAFNFCSSSKMWNAYSEMRRANCRNCDKYFHCIGNYNAVHSCSGSIEDKKATAERISNLREWNFGGKSADSAADQRANLFGRNGGNCGAMFLRTARCAYNPVTKRCGS